MSKKLRVALDWTPRNPAATSGQQRWLTRTTEGFSRVNLSLQGADFPEVEVYADARGMIEVRRWRQGGKAPEVLYRGSIDGEPIATAAEG